MNMRSPLSRARGLGSAKSGTDQWWIQRLTALALIPLVIWFVVSMIIVTGADHAAALEFIRSPINSVLLILLIVATFHHGQLGLQVVIEDYIHTRWL
ncbi:MAG: succinate dehydrogenase, hydrophobic membrane anchor protein, partial [Rhodospirillaceae bacterium]|nr:succinate dehydrogenase, hydrophobic membrane anchor protein [Rhodospirillaceae bacterium]